MEPFLKWAGGKRLLLPSIVKHLPSQFNSYFEPFLGSGALYFYLKPNKAYLSDLSDELINTYTQIRDNVDGVIKLLRSMKYTEESYYKIRKKNPIDLKHKAARFIYLNKTCWNGLYRVNSKGEFNVPFGKHSNPKIYNPTNLREISETLKNVRIKAVDFETSLTKAKSGDLVYLDPPYTTSHNNNGFIEYNSHIFSLKDQIRLRDVFEDLTVRGCSVILSNSDHEFIRELYKGFKRTVVPRRNTISSNVNKRGVVTELVITNF